LVNGSLGTVVGFSAPEEALAVQCDFAKEIVSLAGEHLPNLKLAYAITVHSAQGSQFDRVIVLIERSQILNRTLVYTALARAVHQVVFVGDEEAFANAVRAKPHACRRQVRFSI